MRLVLIVAVVLALSACAALNPSQPTGAGRSQQTYGQAAGGQTVRLSQKQASRMKRIMAPLVAKMNNPIPINQVRVTVLADQHINAANGGGGDFYVSEGLLKKANDDELRAIMAHETAHADLGHVSKIQTVATGVAIGAAVLGQIWPGSEQLAPLAGQLAVSSYSRSEESAADVHGVTILRRAGYDGKRLMIDALSWIQRTEGNSGGGFFETHPATGDRIQELRNMP